MESTVVAKAKKAKSPKKAARAEKAAAKKLSKKQQKLELKLAAKNSPDKLLAIVAMLLCVISVIFDHLNAQEKKKRQEKSTLD